MLMLETHCHIRACDVTSFARPDWLLMLSDSKLNQQGFALNIIFLIVIFEYMPREFA